LGRSKSSQADSGSEAMLLYARPSHLNNRAPRDEVTRIHMRPYMETIWCDHIRTNQMTMTVDQRVASRCWLPKVQSLQHEQTASSMQQLCAKDASFGRRRLPPNQTATRITKYQFLPQTPPEWAMAFSLSIPESTGLIHQRLHFVARWHATHGK